MIDRSFLDYLFQTGAVGFDGAAKEADTRDDLGDQLAFAEDTSEFASQLGDLSKPQAIEKVGGNEDDRLIGTRDDDDLRSFKGNDTLIGKSGNDTLKSTSGDDLLKGGGGSDSLVSGGGNDRLIGGGGNDTIKSGGGNDTIKGGGGNDVIKGGGGSDDIKGNGGDDDINGGGGSDTIVAGPGNDTIKGGGGADLIKFSAGDIKKSPTTTIKAFQSIDVIDLGGVAGLGPFSTLDLTQVGRDVVLQIDNSQIIFKGRSLSDLSADNFILANNAEPVAPPANANPVVAGPVTDGAGDTDQDFTVNLLEGASDPDSFDTVQVSGLTLVSGDASGVTVNGDSLTVDPSAYNALAVGQIIRVIYEYNVIDGRGGSVAQSATITIVGENSAPNVSAQVTGSGSEDGATFSVNLLDNVFDPDAGDTLSVSNVTRLSGDIAGVTIDEDRIVVDPSFYNNLANDETETIIFTYDVIDGSGGSVGQTATIQIIGANDAPSVSAAITSGGSEDGNAFSVDLLANASDPDSADLLSIVSFSRIAGDDIGVTLNGTRLDVVPGAYTRLSAGELETIIFDYQVTDGQAETAAQAVTITITGANDPTEISAEVDIAKSEDAAAFIVDLLANASDPDANDILSVDDLALASGDDKGVTINGKTLEINPGAYDALDQGDQEVLTFTYNVTDGRGGSVAQTATVTIEGANDTPRITAEIVENRSEDDAVFLINLLQGASDIDDAAVLSVEGLTPAPEDVPGVSLDGVILSIDPGAYNSLAATESETVVFTFNIIDGLGGSVAQKVTLTILGANDAPTVSAEVEAELSENAEAPFVDLTSGANDDDIGDVLSISNLQLVSGYPSGVTLNGARLEIDPTAFDSLDDGDASVLVYTYNIIDGLGGSVAQTATITIRGANDAPTVFSAISKTRQEDDSAFSIDLLEGANDVDASAVLTVSDFALISGDGSGVSQNGSSLDVDPSFYNALAVGETEVITFAFNVTDGLGGSVAQTATITIIGANDEPTVAAEISEQRTQDDAEFRVDLLNGATDPDTSDQLSVVNVIPTSADASGVSLEGSDLVVDPSAYLALAEGDVETIVYTFQIEDQNGGSVTQTATITILGANDSPRVLGPIVEQRSEDDAEFSVDLLQGATDPDQLGDLSVTELTLSSGNDAGVSIDGSILTIDPNAYNALSVGQNEVIVYRYDIAKSTGETVSQMATITIEGANDAPIVSAEISAQASEDDASFSVDLLENATDPDTLDTLSVDDLSVVSGDASGVTFQETVLNVDPSFYETLAQNEAETIVYSYNVIDENGGSTAQTATITITGVNDDPFVTAEVAEQATEDDDAFSVDLLNAAVDPDLSDGLSVDNLTLISGSDAGVSVDGSTLDITPSAYGSLAVGEAATIVYAYDVIDGNGGSVAQTATVTIAGVNDAPTVSAEISVERTEDDSQFTVELLNNASDGDTSDVLSVENLTLTSGDDTGVSIDGGTLTIDPSAYDSLAEGERETIVYSYDVADNNEASVAQTATITILGANDAPTVGASVGDEASEDAGAFSVDLLQGATDVDRNSVLSVSAPVLTSGDDRGVTINETQLDIDPAAYGDLGVGETETIVYSYNVIDDEGASVPQVATVTIIGANDAPIVQSEVIAGATEGGAEKIVNLLSGASDPDTNDVLTIEDFALVSGNAAGVTRDGTNLTVDPTQYSGLSDENNEVIVFSYNIVDKKGGSVPQIATVTIAGSNDDPTVEAEITAEASEDAATFSVDLLAGAADPDTNDVLSVSDLTLSSGDDVGVSRNGSQLDVDPAQYQRLGLDEVETIIFTYNVTDGRGGSVAQTATITIVGANDAPELSAEIVSETTEDDDEFSLDLLSNATDKDENDVLSVADLTLVSGDDTGVVPAGAFLDINPDAYDALSAGETRTLIYAYNVIDSKGGSAAQTATIIINGVNDTPTVDAALESEATEDDAAFDLDLLAGASDDDALDVLSVDGLTLVSGSDAGVTTDGATLSIDPSEYNGLAADETEIIVYSYQITDGNDGVVTQTATVTITGVNDAPTVLAAIEAERSEDDDAFTIDLLQGASDVDLTDVLAIDGLVLSSGNGAGVTIDDASLLITPSAYDDLAAGENEIIVYSYNVIDNKGGSVPQTATVTITGANDAPTVIAQISEERSEDTDDFSLNLLTGASDIDRNSVLSVTDLRLVSGSETGVTINLPSLDIDMSAFNSLAADETATIVYAYNISDGLGGLTAQTATITIIGANDAPTLVGQVEVEKTEDADEFTVDLLDGASDADNSDVLTISDLQLISGSDDGVSINGSILTIDPSLYDSLAATEAATIVYAYQVTDGRGGSIAQTATITINGVNDEPFVEGAISATRSEDDNAFIVDLLDRAADPDATDVLTVSGLTLSSGVDGENGVSIGVTTLNIDPSAYNGLAAGEVKTLVYSYDVTDGNGGTVAQTATITILGANDAPTVEAQVQKQQTEDADAFTVDLLEGATDPDLSDDLTVTAFARISGDDTGVSFDGSTNLDITPSAYNGLSEGQQERIVYTYTITDNRGGSIAQTATITILGANDAPIVEAQITDGAKEDDETFTVDLLLGATDPDTTDTLSVSSLTLSDGSDAGVTIDGANLIIDPSEYNSLSGSEAETIVYTYNVTDQTGATTAQTATITITGVNDAPILDGEVDVEKSEDDATFVVNLLQGATDPDTSDVLAVTPPNLASGDDKGVTINGAELIVDPSAYNSLAAGETETIVYSYSVTDNRGGTLSQTATIVINGANDDPTVASAVTKASSEDAGNFTVDLLSGASDPDASDALTIDGFELVSGDGSGVSIDGSDPSTLNVNASAYNGLAAGETEVIEYSYNVLDGKGGSVAQTATITIIGANDDPTVSAPLTRQATEDDSSFTFDLLTGATDDDISDVLSIDNLVKSEGDDAGVSIVGSVVTVTPSAYNALAADETEIIIYTYQVSDSRGGLVDQTATITITGRNDAPTVSAEISSTKSEDVAGFTLDLLANATDHDGSDVLSVDNLTRTSGNAGGVTENSTTLGIDPSFYNGLAAGQSEVITYTYNVIDGEGGSVAQTATVTIVGANDDPTISGQVTGNANEEDAAFVVNLLTGASDPDANSSLSVTDLALASGDDAGVTIDGTTLSVDPNSYRSLIIGETETIVYTYDVSDGIGGKTAQTATITINGTDNVREVLGSSNDDLLSGGVADERISGFAGNDTLAAGAGTDTLVGGAGSDKFVVRLVDGALDPNVDVIEDFSYIQSDRIGLTEVLSGVPFDDVADVFRATIVGADTVIAIKPFGDASSAFQDVLLLKDVQFETANLLSHGVSTPPANNPTIIDNPYGFQNKSLQSANPQATRDGAYVVWVDTTNLDGSDFDFTPNGGTAEDRNSTRDVFLFNTQTRTLQRVTDREGDSNSNVEAVSPVVSANGRYVAYVEERTAKGNGDSFGDVFVRDMAFPETAPVAVSVDNAGVLGSNGTPLENSNRGSNLSSSTANESLPVVDITDDGRKIVFATRTSLVVDDADSKQDIYLRDLDAGTTTLISDSGAETTSVNDEVKISADGRYIAFQSTFSFDAADDDSGTAAEDEDLYVYDTVTDSYLLISSTLKGELSGFDMNDDGDRFVFSTEEAINANDANGFRDVYVADVDLESFTVTSRQRVSEAEGGFELTDGESYAPTISPDGEKVAFLTQSETIVDFREDFFPDPNDGLFDELLFIVDLPTGELLTPPTAVAVGPSREELSTHLAFTDDGFFYRPLTSPVDGQGSAGIIEAGTGQALTDIDVGSVVIDRTTTLRSSIDFAGDLDIFEIKSTSSGGNYFVSIEAAGAGVGSLSDPSVRVLESDGDVARGASGVGFAEDDNGGLGSDAFTGFQLTNNGSRFIEVSSADGSLGSYVLRVGTSVSVLDDPLPAADDFIF